MGKKIFFYVLFFIFLGIVQTVWADPGDLALEFEQYMEILGIDEIEQALTYDTGISFRDLLNSTIMGELDLSPQSILNQLMRSFFSEIYSNSALMRHLLVISILSALLKNLTESFKNKGVGELGFYACYIVLIIALVSAFGSAVSITQGLISTLSNLMLASIPLLVGLLFMSGEPASSYILHPVMMFGVSFIALFVNYFLAPFIIMTCSVEIINYITEKEMLGKFCGLLRKGCMWLLGGVSFLFLTILSLQKISSPILNRLAIRTARAGIGAIPVVGDIMRGATDIVLYWAQAAKSSTLVALIIAIFAICLIPVMKLLALIVIFKFTAAVTQPVCDPRIVKCINTIGNYCSLLLGCCVTVIVMFILMAVVLLSF